VDIQCLEQFRDGGDLIALAGDLFLAENDAQFRREGADHVNGALAATARPAYRFAIDPQAAFQGTDHPSHPTAERRLELLRVEGSEDAQKRFLGGNAVLEHQELTQPIFLLTSPMGDVFDGVTVGEHRCDSRHENLQEVMQRPIAGFARVVHFSETAHQACPLVRVISVVQKTRVEPISRGFTSC
jgi:hypothetical protein